MSFRLIASSVLNNAGNRGTRMRHLWRAVAWQLRKRTIATPVLLRLANGVRFKAYPDCIVSSSLIYSDWPEYLELQFLRRTLCHGEIVIDVGANVGHVSLLLADIVGPENIFAFEPTPVSFSRLVENWKLNGWTTESLFQMAVGRTTGIAEIPDTCRPDTKNSVISAVVGEPTVEVPLVSLDSRRGRWSGRRIGLLKLDVENFEKEVFAGAIALLNDDRPRLVMFESLGTSVQPEIATVLTGAKYRIFQLNNAGEPDFARHSSQNLFAMPEERLDSINQL